MKHLSRILPVIFAVATVLSLSSCFTQPPSTGSEPIVIQAADLHISLTPLDYERLKDRHGKNDYNKKINPYIDFPGQMPQRRIVVFEADISTSESTVQINLQDISLRIDEKGGRAASAEYLNNLWLVYINETAWRHTIPAVNRKYILPREMTITPDQPVHGYLVFAEPYPKGGGAGLLSIAVSTPDGDTGILEEELWFSENGAESGPGGNTGIFTEDTAE